MFAFTFEIVRYGEKPVIANVLTLADERAIWCHVEAIALRIKSGDDAFIRVKNRKGETIVRAGVVTARASIETCSCETCPLKLGLRRRSSVGSHVRPELGFDFVPCERRGSCSCEVGGLS
jgi:hypothetical protein